MSMETRVLQTALPDVTVTDLQIPDLPKVKTLLDKNRDFFKEGGLDAPLLYTMTERELKGEDKRPGRRMGIWLPDDLIGFVGVVPYGPPHKQEIVIGIDEHYTGKNIAGAVIKVVADQELENGNDVVGEVETDNNRGGQMVKKLGCDDAWYDRGQGRRVYMKRSRNTSADAPTRVCNLLK